MHVLDRLRSRWRHFLGRDMFDDLESRRAALEAELDFGMALQQMQRSRTHFDRRQPSDPPREMTSISGLNARLDYEDQLVREALNGEEDDN